MRLPQTRYPTHRPKKGIPLFMLLLGSLTLAALVGSVYLVVTRDDGIVALPKAEEAQTLLSAWEEGDYPTVITDSETMLRTAPLDYDALVLNGFAHFYTALEQVELEEQSSHIVASIVSLRRALLLHESRLSTEVQYVLGKAYFHRGEYFYDLAVEHLERSHAQGQNTVDLYEYLAAAYQYLGNLAEAERNFAEALRTEPVSMYALALAEVQYQAGDDEAALNYLAQARVLPQAEPLLDRIELLAGEILRKRQDYTEAIARYDAVIERNRNAAAAHFGKGETYLAMGQKDRARFEWREAVRLDPNHIESLQRLQED